jgi:hypothetical protein
MRNLDASSRSDDGGRQVAYLAGCANAACLPNRRRGRLMTAAGWRNLFDENWNLGVRHPAV